MMETIDYECLRCFATWTRPAHKEPLAECPKCRTKDWDKATGVEKVCPVCLGTYRGNTSLHSNKDGPCSQKCREKNRFHKPVAGVFI